MRRLTSARESSHEAGAVAVVFAVLFLVLVGFVGVGVDLAAAYARTQELQNGADAAALGVAQECAMATPKCDETGSLAPDLAERNVRLPADAVETTVRITGNRVRAVAQGEHDNFFLNAFGQPSFTIAEEAIAGWGAPIRGVPVLPLTFSRCNFEAQDWTSGAAATINFTKTSPVECQIPMSGNVMPGGFAYFGDGNACGNELAITGPTNGWFPSAPGNSPPSDCNPTRFETYIGKIVLLPVYDGCRVSTGNAPGCTRVATTIGNQGDYHLYAFAAFKLAGYHLGGQYSYPESTPPCGGNARCVRGSFVEYVSFDDAWEYGTAPDSNATIVTLTD